MPGCRPSPFIGWFGPRGLASLVFVVIVLDSGGLPHDDLIIAAALATVLLSVVAHGVTAIPLVRRATPPGTTHGETEPGMEHVHVHEPRWRGQPRRPGEAAGQPPGTP